MESYAGGGWTQNQSLDNLQQNNYVYKIGIYGWRKRCLYIFLLLITIMVVINIALTLWIVKVLDFSTHGMGKLRISEEGFIMEGDAHFLHTLYSSHIRSPKNKRLVISSDRNLTLNARNGAGYVVSSLFIGNHKLESLTNHLILKNKRGKILFSASEDKIEVPAEVLKVTGVGGAEFKGSIQTANVMSDYYSSLKLDSPTRTVNISAPHGIFLESTAGDVHAICINDLKIESLRKAIKIIGEEVYLEKLPIVSVSNSTSDAQEVFQLCTCRDGKLYMAPSTGHCFYDPFICEK